MVTLKEVAAAAQVSTVTASSVLSGVNRVRVSPATAERIHRIAKSMNYVPLAAARGLRTGKTRIIAFVTPAHSIVRPASIWHEALRGVSDLMWEREERLMLVMPRNNEHELEILRQMAYGRQVDGFILQDAGENRERIELLAKSERPFVVMDGVPVEGVNTVTFDLRTFVGDIANSLEADGCGAVVGIMPARGSERLSSTFQEFFSAWGGERGIPFHPWNGAFVPDAKWLADLHAGLGGKRLGVVLLRALLPETLNALSEAGLQPGRASNIVYVSTGEDLLLTPEGVSVMLFDYYTLGRRSARLLFRLVDGDGVGGGTENLVIPAIQKV